jgi:hypothetical protein
MKEPYGEGLANHSGPAPCASGRKAKREALVGVRAGEPLSPEKIDVWGSRRGRSMRKATRPGPSRRGPGHPTGSETLSTHGNSSHGTREIPRLAADGMRSAQGIRKEHACR